MGVAVSGCGYENNCSIDVNIREVSSGRFLGLMGEVVHTSSESSVLLACTRIHTHTTHVHVHTHLHTPTHTHTHRSGRLVGGEWAVEGCYRNDNLSNTTVTVCECNHLTHFAILLSPGPVVSLSDDVMIITLYGIDDVIVIE